MAVEALAAALATQPMIPIALLWPLEVARVQQGGLREQMGDESFVCCHLHG
jgi:hypothetical protein